MRGSGIPSGEELRAQQARLRAEHDDAEARGARARRNGHTDWRTLDFTLARDMRPQLESLGLVKGLINREQLSLTYGLSGCGKTFLALDRDLSIAAGLPWFSHKVRQGRVVYLAIEAGKLLENRVVAWLTEHGLAQQDIPFAAITSPVDLCHLQPGDVPLVISTIQQTIGWPEIALLDIDTVNRALAGGDENAPADMGAFVYAMDLLRSSLHCHVSGIHHTGKTTGRGPRGHSSLAFAVEVENQVERMGETKTSTMIVKRCRDGISGEQLYFELPQVELGHDEDGDPVTSCIVKQVDGPIGTAGTKPKTAGLKDREKIAYEQLINAINAAGTKAPPETFGHGGLGKTVVPLETWRLYTYSAGFADGEKSDTRKRAFQRTRESLAAVGLVTSWAGSVWVS